MATKATALRARQVFLDTLAATGNVTKSANAANLDTSALYRLKDRNAEFREKWECAEEAAYDLLLEACRSRAIEGVMKPVVSMGVVVCEERVFSDSLASKLLDKTAPSRRRIADKVDFDATVTMREIVEADKVKMNADELGPASPVL